MIDLMTASCTLCTFSDLFDGIDDDLIVPIAAILAGSIIAVVAITGGIAKQIMVARAREASRREIAAYIAEGSITAEEGERLLSAGRSHLERWGGCRG